MYYLSCIALIVFLLDENVVKTTSRMFCLFFVFLICVFDYEFTVTAIKVGPQALSGSFFCEQG